MKNPLLIIITVLMTVQTANSNTNFYFGLSGGYSNFDMQNFRSVTNSISYYNIKLPVVDNFPSNYFGKVELYIINDSLMRFGINFRSESTGATVGLKDYSGEIKVEQYLTGLSFGTSLFYILKPSSYFDLLIGAELGLTKSKYEIFEKYKVFDEQQNSNVIEKFNNLYFQPGLKVEIPYNDFRFSLYADLYIGIKDFYFGTNESAIAKDWNGLRYGLMVSYLFY